MRKLHFLKIHQPDNNHGRTKRSDCSNSGNTEYPRIFFYDTSSRPRDLHLMGDGAYLPSLAIRRIVGALCFLYKRHFSTGLYMLLTLLPPRATNTSRHGRRTRQHPSHQFQLTSTLQLRAWNDVLRSFPGAVWNRLPQCVLLNQPTRKVLQPFKEKVKTICALPAGSGQRTGCE